jgi:hypothetical protein
MVINFPHMAKHVALMTLFQNHDMHAKVRAINATMFLLGQTVGCYVLYYRLLFRQGCRKVIFLPLELLFVFASPSGKAQFTPNTCCLQKVNLSIYRLSVDGFWVIIMSRVVKVTLV